MISRANKSDTQELLSLVQLCYRGEDSLKGWTTEHGLIEGTRANEATILKMLEDTVIFKLEEDGHLIGCAYAERIDEDRMSTGMLCVHPDKQGRGLGRKLIEAVEDYAIEQGCSHLWMQVVHVRDVLIAWYGRLGFVKTGEVSPFPDNSEIYGKPLIPLHMIEMVKHIKTA